MSLIHTLKTPPGSGVVAAATLIPTSVKTSAYTAAAGDFVPVDTTSAAVTITLPASASDGAQVGVKLVVRGTGSAKVVTIACSGSDVINRSGGATTYTLTTLGQASTLQYKSGIWYVTSGDLALSQLDGRYIPDSPLSVGQEVFSRSLLTGTTLTNGSGQLRMTMFTARKTEVTTQVRTLTQTPAASGATLCRIGLYLVDDSDGGTLVASVANDLTLWTAVSTAYTRSWSSSYQMVAGQRYALAWLAVATTAPNFAGAMQFQPQGQSEANVNPRILGLIVSQTDLPSSYTNSQLGANPLPYRHYGVILP